MKKNALLLLAASVLLTSGMSAMEESDVVSPERGRERRAEMRSGRRGKRPRRPGGIKRGFDKKKSILTAEEKENIKPFMNEWKDLCEKRRAERNDFIDRVVSETGIDKKDVNKVLAKYRKRMRKKARLEKKLSKYEVYEEPVAVEVEEVGIMTTEE